MKTGIRRSAERRREVGEEEGGKNILFQLHLFLPPSLSSFFSLFNSSFIIILTEFTSEGFYF